MRPAPVVALLIVTLAGCGPQGRGLADPDLTFKAPAIREAVDDNKVSAFPQLIHDLDDDDSAVRFYAIEGLRRLTGHTFDYHYYDEVADRRPAIDRWRAWLQEGRP